MTLDELLAAAYRADREREIAADALARTLTNLYGECHCARHGSEPQRRAACDRHAVDPGLFRRLIWTGMGS